MRSCARATARLAALLLAVLGVVLLTADPAPAAPAQDPPPTAQCRLRLQGPVDPDLDTIPSDLEVDEALESLPRGERGSREHPLPIDVDATYAVTGTAHEGMQIHVDVNLLGGWPSHSRVGEVEGTGVHEHVHVGDKAPELGVGLYQVRVEATDCGTTTFWVLLTGPRWFLTGPSIAAELVGGAGLASLVIGTRRSFRGEGGSRTGWMGAIPFGIGVNVLAQQAGYAFVDEQTIALSTALPSGATALVQRVAALAGNALRARQAGEVGAPPPPAAPARHLQAELTPTDGPTSGVPLVNGLLPGQCHRIEVWIGPPEAQIRAARAFPQEELPEAARHELTVTLSEPVCVPDGVVRTITLPKVGASTRAEFLVDVPSDARMFTAEITVSHQNRVLQTALLRGCVHANPNPEDRIELIVEAVVRKSDDLDARTPFGASLTVRGTEGGGSTMTAIRDEQAQVVPLDGLDEVVAAICDELSDVASNPDLQITDLSHPEATRLLRFLAYQGALLRDKLLETQVDPEVLEQKRLQVLSLHSETYLPLEFIYDRGSPKSDATLCPNAAQALVDGTCSGTCPSGVDESRSPVVCPIGFWCLNRVIERHAWTREALDEFEGRSELVLDNEPTTGRNQLAPVTSAVFAFSERVDALAPPAPSDQVVEVLQRVTGGNAAVAASWDEWRSLIAERTPDLLVLLAHTVDDRNLKATALQIGAGDALACGQVERPFVRAPQAASPPVVLLLGCETAVAGKGAEDFLTRFQEQGASIVVGTLATVLGYQAAPVAAAIVEALAGAAANGDGTFGDVLLDTRRELLSQGLIMAFTLTAYGDADWRLTTADALVPA